MMGVGVCMCVGLYKYDGTGAGSAQRVVVVGGVFDISDIVGIAFGVWLLGVVMGLSKRDDGTGAGSAQRDVSVVGGVVCDV